MRSKFAIFKLKKHTEKWPHFYVKNTATLCHKKQRVWHDIRAFIIFNLYVTQNGYFYIIRIMQTVNFFKIKQLNFIFLFFNINNVKIKYKKTRFQTLFLYSALTMRYQTNNIYPQSHWKHEKLVSGGGSGSSRNWH